MKKWMFLVVLFLGLIALVGCKPSNNEDLTFTVTFELVEGTNFTSQVITNGGKVTKPADPEREGYVFDTWMNGSFEWNFDLDIVTDDLTLTAKWIEISSAPSEIKMIDEAFTSSLEWMQTFADIQTFVVSIKPEDGTAYEVLAGDVTIDTTQAMHVVTFVPTDVPQGGYYYVKIESNDEMVETELLLFGGTGTETNPYVVTKISDVITLLSEDGYENKHYLQINDILSTLTEPLEVNDDRKITFSGVYDGGNHVISFTGNGGLFHEIAEAGVVKNLVIEGTTQLYASEANLYAIGAVANINRGLIENIDTRALLENPRLQGELPVYASVDTADRTTGAGGIAGTNASTGIIRHVSVGGVGAVKAGRGVGGVVAYNDGLIEYATVTATLPAGNQANSGKSSNTYSYGGGIAGFNFGTIQYASVSGRVFAQSAYAEVGAGNEGKNVAFGGIAGYNEGIIRDSSFARTLSLKEFIDKTQADLLGDSANNLGVASIHGDLYIGGIAGINAGDITDVYVGGALIGGRDFVGGIAGLTLGDGYIQNSYVFAEIAIKDDGGVKLTEANAKTTLTTYQIAPSGFDVNTTLFKALINAETDATWVPGDLEMPKLPAFTAEDFTKVGNKFAESGVLLWQQGTITAFNITLSNAVLPFGSTFQIEYSITPANAPDQAVIWTSSNESVAKIVGDGLVEGVGEGSATITGFTRDGNKTDIIIITVEDYIHVDTVTVTSSEMTLPQPNNAEDRPQVEIGTVISFNVSLLPENAQFKGYTLSSSNSRAEINGDEVTFVYGSTGPGRVSITVSFEDTSLPSLEYRFETIPASDPVDTPISSVTITSAEFTLPEANNSEVRPQIEIGTVINLVVDILPTTASNKNYTVTTSNSRAVANGNEITFVYGNTGPGNVSVVVTFEDTSVGINGVFEYRFATFEAVAITSVDISSTEITLPAYNNIDVRQEIALDTVITIVVNILPANATHQGYTITTSNSRATVNGNQVTFVYGNTGPGNVSVFVTFEDTTLGLNGVFEFRFKTVSTS